MAYDGSIKIDTKIDTSGFSGGMSQINALAKKGAAAVTTTFAGISTALGAGGIAATKVGSGFEAAMSKVSAISGAAGGDFDLLSDKAKEMGAKTKFSASESASALQYMAMAGWDTKAMLNGIDGVMNLAAADGLDLATTSDIVTDAITAFGLKASDSSHFADVLAKASSSANTNVSMLGESFKYVAPLAGTMGYSVEDISLALGLMANASVKGSMAGTSLKTALANLAAPTDEMCGVMEKYNLSLADSEGKALPLVEVLKKLREKFGGLSEEEQAAAASTLFGKEAMSGMLAIINSSDSDFKNLQENINNADGAAESMATTMQNNLQGQITILKSGLEGLGIEIYEDLQEPLMNAAIKAQEYVGKLTTAFTDGGIDGLVEEAGTILADIATQAANAAPQMITAAVSFIKSFVRGIKNNKPQLKTAAKEIVTALVDGLVSLLPKEIQKPVKSALKEVQKSFENGGLKEAIKTVGNIIENCGKVIVNITKAVLPPFTSAIDFAADNLDIIIPLLTAGVAAYKGWQIVGAITTLITTHTAAVTAEGIAENITAMAAGTATAAYSVKSVAVGVLTGKIGLATAAQWLWNAAMSANPIGLLITAVAALTGGMVALALTQENELTTAEKQVKQNEDLATAYTNTFKAAKDFYDGVGSAKGILNDFNDSVILSKDKQDDLQEEMKITQDKIGKIATRASEERRQLTDYEVQELEKLFKKEQEIADKQLEVQAAYQTVVKDMATELASNNDMGADEYAEAAKRYIKSADETRDAVVSAAEKQRINVLAERRALIGTDEQYTQEWYDRQKAAADQAYNDAVNTANKEHADTTRIIADGYASRATSLQNYRYELTTSNEEIEQLNADHIDALNLLEQKKNKALRLARQECYTNLGFDQQKYNQKAQAIEQEYSSKVLTENQKFADDKADINQDVVDSFDASAQEQYGVWLGMLGDTEMYGGKIAKKDKDFVDQSLQYLRELPPESKDTMKDAVNGMINGLQEREPQLYEKAGSLANGIISTIKSIFDINSPSRVMKKLFGFVWEGAEIATDDKGKSLVAQAGDVAKHFVKNAKAKLENAKLVAKMKATVAGAKASLTSNVVSKVIHKVDSDNDDDKPVMLRGDIHTAVNIDGRETAIAITPYVSEELAFNN